MFVKLTSSRVGHLYDSTGRVTGMFAQKAGDEVEMKDVEAKRYLAKGLATEVKPAAK